MIHMLWVLLWRWRKSSRFAGVQQGVGLGWRHVVLVWAWVFLRTRIIIDRWIIIYPLLETWSSHLENNKDILVGTSPSSFAVILFFFLFISAYLLAFINSLFLPSSPSSSQVGLPRACACTSCSGISQGSILLVPSRLGEQKRGNRGKLSLRSFFPALCTAYSDWKISWPYGCHLVAFATLACLVSVGEVPPLRNHR